MNKDEIIWLIRHENDRELLEILAQNAVDRLSELEN